MTNRFIRVVLPLALVVGATGCGDGNAPKPEAKAADADVAPASAPDVVRLTPQQITAAGIALVRPAIGGGGGAIELPGTIAGDPQGTQIVSAAIDGRLVSLTRNLGQSVRRGDTLAVIESREAAQLNAEVEAAAARAALARSNLAREQRLFAERVSPEQDLIAARTAATEAGIALRLARQQVAAAGGGGGALNRLTTRAPISGQVIARSATLGQTVAADAELFRVADLSVVSLSLSLSAADAGHVRAGARVEVSAPGRTGQARVTFVSPVLDEMTRQVPLIAALDNRAGQWRVGEAVTASIQLPGSGDGGITVPAVAVQTVDDKPVVFVRTPTGFRAVPVTLGRTNGNRVTVASGLAGREEIAAANSFTLKAELGKGATGDDH
ncbi:efflux RND transporter periplasmic adaptor subunit [Sphingosinicellaceae bacterium]|nr:efflux RND transporter periplasmic adaptor subunit [Sphingosinicellaceae bacterium]